MDPSCPFRPNIIDNVSKLKKSKSDSILSVYPKKKHKIEIYIKWENRYWWNNYTKTFKGKKIIWLAFGTCFITYAKFIRENSFLAKK